MSFSTARAQTPSTDYLDFATEVGFVDSDVDVPFAKPGADPNQEKYLKVYHQYQPFWTLLTTEASEKLRKKNYERIFDEARRKVRSWEATHLKSQSSRMTN